MRFKQIQKLFLSLFLIVSFGVFSFWRSRESGLLQGASSSGSGTPLSPVADPSKMVYKDGQYDGNPADAYYGIIQVRAVIQSGKISDIQFLNYPHDRPNSIRVNTYATPLLKVEAIRTQTSKVDAVSGATFTSAAFVESLTSALVKAKV